MTNEEAIKILAKETSIEAIIELRYYSGFNREKVLEMIQEAMDMGAKALETHIPKKPIEKYADGCLVCPICNGVLEVDYRCPMCGQLIDWSE